ncbi:MAG: Gfo/Idh/MocA family oxidoreductase [Thermodesulfovibrionales bacterium]|nr:Gfo/Idh/MocA family oxidoreductase [Thermodesulfovibrionales bacterium]
MINVAVIGVGYLGQHHARIFSELAEESNDVRLAAIIDSDRKRAEDIARNYECEFYNDYRDIPSDINAVSIVTPTTTHYGIAMDCIEAGRDVLIEKPITTSVEDADRLIEMAEKKGSIIQVGHLERFNPALTAVYPMLDKPVFIEAERLSPFLGRGIDVDVTLDLMIHDIDIVLAIIGQKTDIKDIKATGAKLLTGNIDIAKAWIEFDSGIQALMTSGRIFSERSRKLKIFQKGSYLLVDYHNMEVKKFSRKGNELLQETIRLERKEPLKEELEDFIRCVITRQKPLVSAIEGRNALGIALQINDIIKSAE